MSEKEFPEIRWPEMSEMMTNQGPTAVVDFIMGFDDDLQRRQLFALAHQGFGQREWEGKNFDDLITVVEAGMAEGLAQAERTSDKETRGKLIDFANIMSFNLAADLAECWPGDDALRETKHFAKGVELGQRCLDWRRELKKGPGPFSMAHWVKGMHHLSLGQIDRAESDLQASLDHAVAGATEQEKVAECVPGGDFSVVLGFGYLGLARWAKGDEEGKTTYENALEAFRGTVAQFPEQKDDAQFGLDQLEKAAGKVIK